MCGRNGEALFVAFYHELNITRPNVFRSTASLTGVVSRSKQIAGTFELIYRFIDLMSGNVFFFFDQISNGLIILLQQRVDNVAIACEKLFHFFLYVFLFIRSLTLHIIQKLCA